MSTGEPARHIYLLFNSPRNVHCNFPPPKKICWQSRSTTVWPQEGNWRAANSSCSFHSGGWMMNSSWQIPLRLKAQITICMSSRLSLQQYAVDWCHVTDSTGGTTDNKLNVNIFQVFVCFFKSMWKVLDLSWFDDTRLEAAWSCAWGFNWVLL